MYFFDSLFVYSSLKNECMKIFVNGIMPLNYHNT